MKTIDFYEIEQNPEIVEDVFQQLIGQNVEFSANFSDAFFAPQFIGELGDYIVSDKTIMLIIDNVPMIIDYFRSGYIKIKFDAFLNIIVVCYERV